MRWAYTHSESSAAAAGGSNGQTAGKPKLQGKALPIEMRAPSPRRRPPSPLTTPALERIRIATKDEAAALKTFWVAGSKHGGFAVMPASESDFCKWVATLRGKAVAARATALIAGHRRTQDAGDDVKQAAELMAYTSTGAWPSSYEKPQAGEAGGALKALLPYELLVDLGCAPPLQPAQMQFPKKRGAGAQDGSEEEEEEGGGEEAGEEAAPAAGKKQKTKAESRKPTTGKRNAAQKKKKGGGGGAKKKKRASGGGASGGGAIPATPALSAASNAVTPEATTGKMSLTDARAAAATALAAAAASEIRAKAAEDKLEEADETERGTRRDFGTFARHACSVHKQMKKALGRTGDTYDDLVDELPPYMAEAVKKRESPGRRPGKK